jgi:sigma-B regulation protein RsbQ
MTVGILSEDQVDSRARNNVQVAGEQTITMVFAHGFGCDQNMWRLLAPSFEQRFRTLRFDHVGSGKSDLSAYDRAKYGSLHGYAHDINELLDEFVPGPAIFVGHSVSAMIGMLADLERPGRIIGHVMVGPSPCYVNDGDYVGGFEREDIDELLATLKSNYLGWSSNMAPVIMGAPDRPEFGAELTNSFCQTDPEIAEHFASVTFLSDHRSDLPRLHTPSLILQCSEDIIAPVAVGEYMHRVLPRSTLRIIDNVGHCPHLSAPSASAAVIEDFLHGLT